MIILIDTKTMKRDFFFVPQKSGMMDRNSCGVVPKFIVVVSIFLKVHFLIGTINFNDNITEKTMLDHTVYLDP